MSIASQTYTDSKLKSKLQQRVTEWNKQDSPKSSKDFKFSKDSQLQLTDSKLVASIVPTVEQSFSTVPKQSSINRDNFSNVLNKQYSYLQELYQTQKDKKQTDVIKSQVQEQVAEVNIQSFMKSCRSSCNQVLEEIVKYVNSEDYLNRSQVQKYAKFCQQLNSLVASADVACQSIKQSILNPQSISASQQMQQSNAAVSQQIPYEQLASQLMAQTQNSIALQLADQSKINQLTEQVNLLNRQKEDYYEQLQIAYRKVSQLELYLKHRDNFVQELNISQITSMESDLRELAKNSNAEELDLASVLQATQMMQADDSALLNERIVSENQRLKLQNDIFCKQIANLNFQVKQLKEELSLVKRQ